MVDNDIVLAKTASVERCLERVRQITGGDPERLDDQDIQDIFVLNVERAVQAVIDLAVHVIAARGWGLPDTLKENFRILEERGVVTPGIAARMRNMVGFRNIAVHDYQSLDPAILKSILKTGLDDLRAFCAAILKL